MDIGMAPGNADTEALVCLPSCTPREYLTLAARGFERLDMGADGSCREIGFSAQVSHLAHSQGAAERVVLPLPRRSTLASGAFVPDCAWGAFER